MNNAIAKLDSIITATILVILVLIAAGVVASAHFYEFRQSAKARIAELETRLENLEDQQRAVNAHLSRELSRTQGQLWTLEKITRGGHTNGRTKGPEQGASINRPKDRGPQREGNRGHIAPAKISGST